MQNLSPGRLAFLLATLVALGPLAIDTYLPALLAMSGHFAVEIHAVEVSVSVYVLGVAAGQWLGGPLSDQFGRKPVAYVGLTLFILGCLSIPLSSNIEMLYMLRFLQALGGGATVVIAAASVRDHFTGKEAAKVMTTIGLVMLVAPLVAPALGALLLKLLGWQSIFYMLAVYGVMLFGFVRFLLPSVPVQSKSGTEPLRQRMFLAYGRVLSNRQAMGFILANGLAFAAMFTFITDAAFLYMEYFGITPEQFPLYFGANVVTMLGMNRLNVLLLRRYSSASIMQVALALQVAACIALLGLTLTGLLTLWLVVPLIMVAAGMVALIMPNGIASFLDLFERDSGAATGLNGALQFLLAGLIGTVLGMLHDGSTLPMTALMAASSVAAWVAFSLLARRQA